MLDSMMTKIKNHLRLGVPLTTIPASRSDQIVRKLVSIFSRGNLNLQFGHYTTENDLKRIKESLRDHRFSVTD